MQQQEGTYLKRICPKNPTLNIRFQDEQQQKEENSWSTHVSDKRPSKPLHTKKTFQAKQLTSKHLYQPPFFDFILLRTGFENYLASNNNQKNLDTKCEQQYLPDF